MHRPHAGLTLLVCVVLVSAIGKVAQAQDHSPLRTIDGLLAQSNIPPGAEVCERTGDRVFFCRAGTRCCRADRSCCPTATHTCTSNGCVAIGTDCGVCYRNLYGSVRARAGGNPGFLRTYVTQAIQSYQNCRARARGSCDQGDQLVQALRVCYRFNDAGFAACTKQGVGLPP